MCMRLIQHSSCRGVLVLAAFLFLVSPHGRAQTVETRIDSLLARMTAAEKISQLHHEGGFNTADNTRLNIPGFIMADGPHGVRDGLATCFPVGIAMAATWDPEVIQRVGLAMGKEFRAKGKHQALGPCLDLCRDPRNGRSAETGGEDPYLCAQITTALVRGIQSTPCIATVKHYNGNHRETTRTNNNVLVSQRLLMEHYGLSFRTAVQRGGAMSVMNAYNLINGEKCAENYNLLTSILRTQWGFPYYVVSDWGSIWNSEAALTAGCDICMGSDNYQNDLPLLVQAGVVSPATLDSAVRHVLRTKTLAGMLDYIPPGDPADLNSKQHQELSLEAARKSIVLLKNQGNILPLSRAAGTLIGLIGPSAAVAQLDGTGSAYVTPFYSVSPKQGLEQKLGPGRVVYTEGCDINSADTSRFAAAAMVASNVDVVIYCGGLDATQEGEGLDRVGSAIDLPGKQQDLINRLASVNQNLIVVLFSGGVCGVNRCIDNAKGLLYAFYPGQEGGTALADILFGDYTPGGKLPVTMPKTTEQLPAWNDDFNDDFGCGYRWFDQSHVIPQFAFGYGLSYTTFAYSNLMVTPASATPGTPITVTVDVTNTGPFRGDEVAQLYLLAPGSSVPMPVKQLKGFKRVPLEPAQTTRVSFILTADELYYFNDASNSFEVEPGVFTVRVGGSSDNLPLSADLTILDGPRKPDLLITGITTVPRYPVLGDRVLFLATIKNQGAGPSPAGTPLKVSFRIGGRDVSWTDEFSGSIPTGGMALVCANKGPAGSNMWNADTVGTFSIEGRVDPENVIDEAVEENNTLTIQASVVPTPPKNLALRKSVMVSSVERPGLEGEKAVDGSPSTRWSSLFSDPQSITVDLGGLFNIGQVVLRWETAFGTEYEIQLSDNGSSWTTAWHELNGNGDIDVISISATARYVKMLGLRRGTPWGYSLYEFEVYGPTVTAVAQRQRWGSHPDHYSLGDNFPNPFNPLTTISYDVPVQSVVGIEIYSILGQRVTTLVDSPHAPGTYSVQWDGRDRLGRTVASGPYLYRMIAGQFDRTKRLLFLK
jgi:beta-glucosidase